MDEHIESVRTAMDPPWDEVREQRVLNRIKEAQAAGLPRAQPARRRDPRLLWGGVGFAVAAAAAIILTLVLSGGPDPTIATTPPVEPGRDPSRLELQDGSIATLSGGAEVRVVTEEPDRVAVAQSAGRVRYDVVPNPSRAFEVDAGDVRVRVLGTVFTVSRAADAVTVAVERGRVEVTHEERRVVLRRGEQVVMSSGADEAQAPATPEREGDLERGTPEPHGPSGDDSAPGPGPAQQRPARPDPPAPSRSELRREVQRARAERDHDRAAELLDSILRRFGQDELTLYHYGSVERLRGRHPQAAARFEACHRLGESLAEDCLAEQARSSNRSGRRADARRAARRYLELYPEGTHSESLRALAN